MKLYLTVTPFFPTPDNWRGPFVLDQVKALKRAGVNVIVFKPSSKKDAPSYEIDGITVHHFHARETPSYLFNGLFNRYNSNSFIKRLSELNIRVDDISFVHGHTTPFGIYGLALKKLNPKIFTIVQQHELDPYLVLNGRLAGWKPNLLYRANNSREIIEGADLNLVISDAVGENLRTFPSVRPEETYHPYLHRLSQTAGSKSAHNPKIYKLYNGVDTSVFKDNGHLAGDEFRIGCIGNFQYLKRQADLIQATAILLKRGIANLKVIFIGSGATLDECKNLAHDLNLENHIEFLTEMPHEELCNFYNSLDLFVLPSIFEGFGCVCTEAAACGVPFMICRGQGAAEYFTENERHLWELEPCNPNDIADKIYRQYIERNKQTLAYPIDIDTLVGKFVYDIIKPNLAK